MAAGLEEAPESLTHDEVIYGSGHGRAQNLPRIRGETSPVSQVRPFQSNGRGCRLAGACCDSGSSIALKSPLPLLTHTHIHTPVVLRFR